jgi:flagellar basal-body rod protein FlgB
MNFIDSNHSKMLEQAMDAYSLRQKMSASNIANVDTPGYTRHEVQFEELLKQAGDSSSKASTTPTIEITDKEVILEEEMIEMADTQMRVQLVARSLRHHFDMLRRGITGINR